MGALPRPCRSGCATKAVPAASISQSSIAHVGGGWDER